MPVVQNWMPLQSVCSESASFDLPAGVLASCVQEVQSALEIALVRREDGAAQRGGEIFVAGAGTHPIAARMVVLLVQMSVKYAFSLLNMAYPARLQPVEPAFILLSMIVPM